jgi:hypothetical protein
MKIPFASVYRVACQIKALSVEAQLQDCRVHVFARAPEHGA